MQVDAVSRLRSNRAPAQNDLADQVGNRLYGYGWAEAAGIGIVPTMVECCSQTVGR